MRKELILASKSKRRHQILESCSIRHRVVASNAREISHDRIHSAKLVIKNAERKARAVAGRIKKGVILGVDTVVLLEGKNIGKPKDRNHARKILKMFTGRTLAVYSGLCLIDAARDKKACGFEKTILRMKEISDKDIDRYFLRLGPYDKAGGFSIEGPGAIIFDDLKGSYFNVLGLPMAKLAELFGKLGLDILDFMR